MYGELKRHYRDTTWALRIPRTVHDLAIRLRRTRERLAPRARAPTHHRRNWPPRPTPPRRRCWEALGALKANEIISLTDPLRRRRRRGGRWPTRSARPDDEYARIEQRVMLDELLKGLTVHEQSVIRLRFTEDLTQREIGSMLGVSQMAVSRLLKALLPRLTEGRTAHERLERVERLRAQRRRGTHRQASRSRGPSSLSSAAARCSPARSGVFPRGTIATTPSWLSSQAQLELGGASRPWRCASWPRARVRAAARGSLKGEQLESVAATALEHVVLGGAALQVHTGPRRPRSPFVSVSSSASWVIVKSATPHSRISPADWSSAKPSACRVELDTTAAVQQVEVDVVGLQAPQAALGRPRACRPPGRSLATR